MKRILSIFCICALLICSFTACSSGRSLIVGNVGSNNNKKWTSKHTYYNGTENKTINIKENQPAVISVDIETEEGEIDVSITDDNGTSYYKGTNIPTSNFSVELAGAGKYHIQVTTKKHKGKFAFIWNKD